MTTAAICATREVLWAPSYPRGEQYDSDLGLYYLRARYYKPLTARFMGRDPDDHGPLSPNEMHKYLYASGDPVNAMDPTGRGDLFESALVIGGSAAGPATLFIEAAQAGFAEWLESGPVSFVAARIPDLIQWIVASERLNWIYRQVGCLVLAGAIEQTFTQMPDLGNERLNSAQKTTIVTLFDRVCIDFKEI